MLNLLTKFSCLIVLEILGNVFIATYFPSCDVINFEMNLAFLIKPFYYLTKKSRQTFKYLENKKTYSGEINAFIIFKGPSVAKNSLIP